MNRTRLRTRLTWLLFGQWVWPIQRWYARRTCGTHEPVAVRRGLMREFMEGGKGRQVVMCARCSVVLREFPS